MLFQPSWSWLEITEFEEFCFFLEARSNSKIRVIKTKGIVIYHGDNNGGNNDYCGQRLS